MQSSIVFMVGKHPKPGTVIARAIEILEAGGRRCRVLLPHDEEVTPAAVADAGLVVHRGLDHRHDPLLAAVAGAGVPLCNPWDGF
ncbi:hypothetical protein NLM24_38180 [Nocardia zapadnayensis]|nr:hypothetical protein [Nocardia zapadnayensis]MCX0276387.1 hypothetical protein [Nocardia zapadnayensis]